MSNLQNEKTQHHYLKSCIAFLAKHKKAFALSILAEVLTMILIGGAVTYLTKHTNIEAATWKEPQISKYEIVKIDSNGVLLKNSQGSITYGSLNEHERFISENEKYLYGVFIERGDDISYYPTEKDARTAYKEMYQLNESLKLPLRCLWLLFGVMLMAFLQTKVISNLIIYWFEPVEQKKKEI